MELYKAVLCLSTNVLARAGARIPDLADAMQGGKDRPQYSPSDTSVNASTTLDLAAPSLADGKSIAPALQRKGGTGCCPADHHCLTLKLIVASPSFHSHQPYFLQHQFYILTPCILLALAFPWPWLLEASGLLPPSLATTGVPSSSAMAQLLPSFSMPPPVRRLNTSRIRASAKPARVSTSTLATYPMGRI